MNRIVVTPAGRKVYLEILMKYINKAKNEGQLDRWDLWLNTDIQENIDYCIFLEKTYDWINIVKLPNPDWAIDFGYKMTNIFKFFKYAKDVNSVYIRLDDDIVYLEPDFFKNMFKFRIENPEPFVIFGNIINNAVISHLHQRNKLLNIDYPQYVWYNCFDPVGTKDHKFCEHIHNRFIEDVKCDELNKWKTSFNIWILYPPNERVSVNCLSWTGKSFDALGDFLNREDLVDEEQWLSVEAPKQVNSYNLIYNNAIASHYAFCTQRKLLDSDTDILQKYKELSNLII